MPPPAEGSNGHIAFHRDIMLVHAYVMFVTSVKHLQLTFKFTFTFMSVFLLENITWVPFMLGS